MQQCERCWMKEYKNYKKRLAVCYSCELNYRIKEFISFFIIAPLSKICENIIKFLR